MSKVKFAYCFSKTLAGNKDRYDVSLQLFKKSIELLSQHYDARVFTDNSTVADLKDINIPVVNLGELDLVFVDDIKLHCLPLLNQEEILVDIDVLILEKLNINTDVDLIFDFIDKPTSWWYDDNFSQLTHLNIKEELHKISVPAFVPNIGFLKINNRELLNEYISLYNSFREIIINGYPVEQNINQFSMIIGQYLLGSIITRGNYSNYSMRAHNRPVEYLHLSGPAKYGD